ncbi:adenosine deaminase family protein [Sphingomonas bacterium]|uniref:adenosine deaminase family protein n=1 Tax=Sphingomonas bacterium TaxID=1895847 RepID=UPI00157546BD|nr:adenosine deaminase [Sphingomonas bacterium]
MPRAIGNIPASAIARPVNDQQRRFFRSIPKAELHCHLLGTIRRATFEDLVRKHDAPVSSAELDALYTRTSRPVGVLHALRILERHVLKAPEDFRRITFEYLQDAASENVRHAEFFWNPTGTVRDAGLRYDRAQEGIVSGIHAAKRAFGISAGLIPSIDREADGAAAIEVVEHVLAHRVPEVIGIGIDYRETDRPPELFVEAYRLARSNGLKTTAHAGEFGTSWRNVATAVDVLGVDRIDHGYTVVDNPDLAARLAASGIIFTIVPTNSYYLRTLSPERWAIDHPIRRMSELGLKLHPNTDDPTLHNVSPAGTWEILYSHLGFDLAALRTMMTNGLAGAWIDDAKRGELEREWGATFDRLAVDFYSGGRPDRVSSMVDATVYNNTAHV